MGEGDNGIQNLPMCVILSVGYETHTEYSGTIVCNTGEQGYPTNMLRSTQCQNYLYPSFT